MNKSLTIGCFIPDPADVTSFYRAMGPLSHLARHYPGVRLALGDLRSRASWWNTLCQSDIVYVQRPGSPAQFEVIKEAQCASRKVWIDFDDDLLSVPASNPGFAHYAQGGIRQMIKNAIELSDLVTVSTLDLGKAVQPHMSKEGRCIVIPNAYDHETFAWMNQPLESREKVIVWRGSKTHDADIDQYAEALIYALHENPEWKFVAFGDMPWRITNRLRPGSWSHQKLPMLLYHRELFNLKPAVLFVPLEDNAFNRSKSNIAFIEATMVGAATVAVESLPEFQRPGIYGINPKSCAEVLQWVMDKTNTPDTMFSLSMARQYITEKVPLHKMNAVRYDWVYQTAFGERPDLKKPEGLSDALVS